MTDVASVASADSHAASALSTAATPLVAASASASSIPLAQSLSSSEAAAQADVRKEEANKLFNAGQYAQAIAAYGAAIDLCPSAALLSNRAFAHLRCESYGSAIADASASMALDATYLKAWYRRGSAYLALSKYKEAKADFLYVCRAKPSDADARAKLEECNKVLKRQAFESAIAGEESKPLSETIDVSSIVVDGSYKGPHLPDVPAEGCSQEACAADEDAVGVHGISLRFVHALMAEFKAQRTVHKKYVVQLLLRVRALLRTYKSLVRTNRPAGAAKYHVCGDTHGQFYDTLNIFALNGEPRPTSPYVFNGDFVDRGSWSVENVLMLLSWKLLFPDAVHLTRGNHETRNMNKMYGFDGEVKAKYDDTVLALFTEVFCALPLAVVIDSKVFVTHGGLFQRDGVALDEIERIHRFREPPEDGLMSDMLWSDPQPFPGRGPSKRGVGQSFGPDVTTRFLEGNGLSLIIRSHEVMDEGYQVIHGGKLITVFSAPNYCDQMNNKGGIVHLDLDCKPTFTSFTAVPHPPVKPMAYASGLMSMFGL